MRTVTLTVNGKEVTTAVEPRMHLADFLRETQHLTGTHLGCEQGVCGACTILLDGVPARSCITFAVACDGAAVTSIEGLDDDDVMAELRQAFSQEHALQCGYCTPGMMIMARDIVSRLPDIDRDGIRIELSGNLCRCTGYVGIVNAVSSVVEGRKRRGIPVRSASVGSVGPAGCGRARARPKVESANGMRSLPGLIEPKPAAGAGTEQASGIARRREDAEAARRRGKPGTALHQSFVIRHPREVVWAYFGNVEQMAGCMPGASLTEPVRGNRIAGQIRVKLGPMSAAFAGEAEHERDAETWRGVIRGTGRDSRSASRASGDIEYALIEESGGAATRVEITVAFSLAGMFAQFARGGIVNDLASRLTAEFARNLEMSIDRSGADPGTAVAPAASAAELNSGSLLTAALWSRIKSLLARIFGR